MADKEFKHLMDEFTDYILELNSWDNENKTKEELQNKIRDAGITVKKIITKSRELEGYQNVMKEKKMWSIFTDGWMTLLIKTVFSNKSKSKTEKKNSDNKGSFAKSF